MWDFVSKIPVEKGWSGEKKFCVTTAGGEKYLLRVSPEVRAERRERLFSTLKGLEKTGISMSAPVALYRDGADICTLYTWIDGEDAREAIPALPEEEQYVHGLDSGRILRIIHQFPAPRGLPAWEDSFNAKIDRKMKLYGESPVKFEGAEAMIAYINANRHLLAGRPVCFQHGDYHIGNMMVDKRGKLVIIDFDSFDYGDPWEEFNRIVWCAQEAPAMARGMVDGYFDGAVPAEFWRLLALYVVTNQLSSVPWAASYGEPEMERMLRQATDVLSWYDSMERTVPRWYENEKKAVR